MHIRESAIEQELIAKLDELKYTLRPDIRDRKSLECNFLDKFDALNRVYLTGSARACLKTSSPTMFSPPHSGCANGLPFFV
ncbi:hypothetical protein ACFOPN_21485 [Xanthomonas hyacinthi]|uniref:hypothetical protein n=1 Tax=Xanthomonas hyacinthi TaxID=56455 RepID=UPI00062DC90E|nr:hypothetical protein [Xanthomonas hyacinthi]KLD80109.1 hypothetical protein Y886_00840 [Xanthomonas hyacinthi DSM 19077]